MNRTLPLVATALIFCGLPRGAAQQPPSKPETFSVRVRRGVVPYHATVTAPLEAVWSALPEAFEQMGFPGGSSTKRGERLYTSRALTIRGRLYDGEWNSTYLDCGLTTAGQAAADVYEVTFVIFAWLTPHDSSTVADVVIDGTARDRSQSSAVYCSGTGKIERALVERLKARVVR